MKFASIITLALLLVACSQKKSAPHERTDVRLWDVELANNLGHFRILLPENFDTLFSWIEYSDCGDPCAQEDYRIQPKTLPVFKESGFYYFRLSDSVEQFTIKHPKITRLRPNADTLLVRGFTDRLKKEAYENSSGKFAIDTIIRIDNRNFAVVAFRSFDTTKKVNIQILSALTSLDGNLVNLSFEQRKNSSDTTSKYFIKTSFRSLQTIKISNGR